MDQGKHLDFLNHQGKKWCPSLKIIQWFSLPLSPHSPCLYHQLWCSLVTVLLCLKKKKKSRRHRLDTCNNIIYEFFGFAKPTAYLVRLWYKLIHYKEASGFPRGKVLGAKAKLFGSLFSNTAVYFICLFVCFYWVYWGDIG